MTNGLHWAEIEKLRNKVHDLSNTVATLSGDVENLPEKIAKLEKALDSFKVMATAAAILASVAWSLLAKFGN